MERVAARFLSLALEKKIKPIIVS